MPRNHHPDSPSPSQVENQKRKWLANNGCTVCGESDPDVLHVESVQVPDCQMMHIPPDARTVVCEDHEPPSLRERHLMDALTRHESTSIPEVFGVALYECGVCDIKTDELVSNPLDENGEMIHKSELPSAHNMDRPRIHTECPRCQDAPLVEYIPIEDILNE